MLSPHRSGRHPSGRRLYLGLAPLSSVPPNGLHPSWPPPFLGLGSAPSRPTLRDSILLGPHFFSGSLALGLPGWLSRSKFHGASAAPQRARRHCASGRVPDARYEMYPVTRAHVHMSATTATVRHRSAATATCGKQVRKQSNRGPPVCQRGERGPCAFANRQAS